MMDNRMKYTIDSNMQFPLVEIALEAGETAYIQQGSMVYHTPSVTLNTRLNGRGSGLGKLMGAIGRSFTSGESMFITQAISNADDGKLALAPSMPGQVIALDLGTKQYRLNDGAFLALDGSAQYKMERQSVGRAFFGGQGGLFVMTTEGEGTLLANSFGSIKKLELNGGSITIDNAHVVAWSKDLNYDIHLENGFLQSIGTGEGIVNTFHGYGEIYVQSLNIETFSRVIGNHIVTGGGDDDGSTLLGNLF
ncbi:MAG: TIGR00266 family protein [Streptococcus orisratti]|uniref:TIGR00266 family protein n=1 Tax=Streptococcus orisratti TaxID=114652 RepID=UPI002357FFF1|nr:TIGR00266 family protein [Streptococcus orisratti]MCI7676930.1 TIGR00266 family protein [Streptococcus orisratti]MDY4001221.1 TIGR00266 family protein [Streptococcus orisratti]MDY5636589.1 TIGR00266 family protein [Streptococcus orisratti]